MDKGVRLLYLWVLVLTINIQDPGEIVINLNRCFKLWFHFDYMYCFNFICVLFLVDLMSEGAFKYNEVLNQIWNFDETPQSLQKEMIVVLNQMIGQPCPFTGQNLRIQGFWWFITVVFGSIVKLVVSTPWGSWLSWKCRRHVGIMLATCPDVRNFRLFAVVSFCSWILAKWVTWGKRCPC